MKARDLQALQVRHRIEEARAAIRLAGLLLDEARDMDDDRASALRRESNKLHDVWEGLGRIAAGETPSPLPSANGADGPMTVEVQDHGESEPEVLNV